MTTYDPSDSNPRIIAALARPAANAPHAGKVIRRRFTDVWKNSDAGWRIAIRQATITSIESR